MDIPPLSIGDDAGEDTWDRRVHQMSVGGWRAGSPVLGLGLGSIVRERALASGFSARQSGHCPHSREEAAMTANPRWTRRPPGSTWGDFGPDDQRGRLNLLTPKKVLQGIAEVKEGRSFCLSLPLDYPGGNKLNPRRHPPKLQPTVREGRPNMNFPMRSLDSRWTDVISDDAVFLHLQYSTQWDSLAHVGQMFDADGDGEPEMVYYNGYRAGEHIVGPIDYRGGKETPVVGTPGARALGVENMATSCIQGR